MKKYQQVMSRLYGVKNVDFLYHYNLNTFTSLEFSNFTIVDQIYVEDPERTSSNIVNDISNSKSKT